MNTLGSEERDALKDSVRRLMSDASTEAAVRTVMETDTGYDAAVWKTLGEMGVVGLMVDEEHGGSGFGPLELEAVMEEAGAALLCSPLLASGVLAAELLNQLGDEALNERLLPRIATGDCIASVVLTGDSGCWTQQGVAVSAKQDGDSWVLQGRGSYVLHGQNAEVLVVVAKTDDGFAAFEVDPSAPSVTVAPLPTFDRTLRLASVDFDDARAVQVEARQPVWQAVKRTLDLALVALAGQQVGGTQKVLDFTVEYAKARVQFGRNIGSFQAIKHMAADLLLETESAISAARYAASCLAESSEKADEAISLAAFACADAYVKTTADSIQMHGGIAFTWEHPAHLYLRAARSSAQLFGGSNHHRENYLTAMGG
ncbi:MAG: acyl-CoA dehydrogenase family protein [Myxococcota bacterium]|jgi:alkylation response protein AidB-like acyl-CoA dehydrogenase|nr:acyl-CoA dehydrogenase family protein [Myxococcota bacterium]